MAKKISTKKYFKSLFSRSEPSLDESTGKSAETKPGDKKKFKLPKLNIKSKGSPSSLKAASEKQQVISAAEPINSPVDIPGWADNSDNIRDDIYATAPRSKIKDFSYSETDLSKPKKFATFSFGLLKKRKKKKEDNISRSTFGLHSPDVEEYDENHDDFSQVEEEQARRKGMLSKSQPVLDTSDSFDIPSPPSIHSNLLQSYFAVSNRTPVSHTAKLQPQQPLTNGSDLLLQPNAQKAPIANIPELQQVDIVPSEDTNNISVDDNLSGSNYTSVHKPVQINSASPFAETATEQNQPPLVTLDCEELKSNSFATDFGDHDFLQQSNANTNVSIAEPISTPLSYHEVNATDALYGSTPNSQPSLASNDTDAKLLPDPVPYTESRMVQGDVLFTDTEQSVPDVAENVAINEKTGLPVNRDAVYGALYESLFPQSFTSEIKSSLPTDHIEVTHDTRKVVETHSYFQNERDVVYSRPLTSDHAFTVLHEPLSHQRTSSYNTPTASEFQINTHSPHSHLTSISSTYCYSEVVDNSSDPVYQHAGIKSKSFTPFENALISLPVASISAPPVHDELTSQGTDTQVTDTIGKAVLVKEVFFNERSTDFPLSSFKQNDMITATGLKMDTANESIASPPPGLTEGYVVPCSPLYLSVGSDVGSAVDVYYSAEEDNMDSLDEQKYAMDKIEKQISLGPSEVTKFEKLSLQVEAGKTIDNVELHLPKMEIGGNKERQEFLDLQSDPHHFLRSQKDECEVPETGRTEFFNAEDESMDVIQVAAKVLPQIKEEELLATPVLQVKTQKVCEFAAPSSSPQGEETRGNWIEVFETADHLNGEERPPRQDRQYLPERDTQSEYVLKTHAKEEDLRMPEFRAKEEKLSPPITEESMECAYTNSINVKSAVTQNSGLANLVTSTLMHSHELQSEAVATEHNRAPRECEWVDTITESADGNRAGQEQVAVELSELKVNTHLPDREAPETLFKRHQHPPEAQADLKQRSLTAASEAFNSEESVTNADQESNDKMNSGYSSLSTTLSPPDNIEESRYRFRKVSLVHETDTTPKQDIVDFRAESNGRTLGTDYSWQDSIDSSSRYSFKTGEPFDTLSYRLSDTSSNSYTSSLLPDATSYSYSNSKSTRELARQPKDDWGRSFLGREESAAPADDTDASCFTGVFKATLVELEDPVAPVCTPPASPETDASNQYDMENLVDTLKSMGPALRPRGIGLRGPPPVLHSALPPIVEDAPSPVTSDVSSPTKKMESGTPAEALNGIYTLPPDLGLKRNSTRDTRSPLELMKKEQPATRTMPLRASATNSIVMRQSSDISEDSNGIPPQQSSSSRLDNSVIFGSYRSSSTDHKHENGKVHQPVFRTSSLPDMGSSSLLKELSEASTTTDSPGSRFERVSFLLSSPPSSSFSAGADDVSSRMSLPSLQSITSSPPSSSNPTRLLSPTSSLEPHRLFSTTESSASKFGQTVGQGIGTSALSTPVLQRSFSHDSIPVGNQKNLLSQGNLSRGSQIQKPEPERNVKYRAFPDAYLTKEKEHGKLNPRPGKMYIFDRPGMCGQRIELRSDVVDATVWELQETISIRVVRGGWVLYEKRNFKGEKIALDEGDIELTCPFHPPEEQQVNGQKQQNGEQNDETSEEQKEPKPARKFIIGSVRRAVRDYSVPEISLFPEENAEGKKVIFRDTSDDARIFGFPIKANSIIINAGLWLVFAKPFFEGVPRVLEVGGYSNPAAWGVEQPYVGSLHPLKVGEPRVENISEPKIEIYERSYFTGRSRVITTNMRDFMTRLDKQQSAFMYTAGSLKVHGGIWVGYEKEGFRGHQYLLEEGEYHDWRVWGGSNPELRSVRVIQADLSDPLMVMFEQPEEEEGAGTQEENTFEVMEAIPDVELFGYRTNSRSIQVFSGAWVAYSHVDFSGNQYILEKGYYSNCADWGSLDTRICSVQPILLAPADGNRTRKEILLYSEPDYNGDCLIYNHKQEAETEKFQTKSCRVVGGSWVLYENKDFTGTMYVLSEGGYTTLTSMGCTTSTFIRSVKAVPMTFSVPSISLFGLEGLEGREVTTDSELISLVGEGFNDQVLSVRVNSGWWVLCEYSNYRGRQFLLEPIEITNWPKFSSLQTVGSMYPVRQKRHFFRIKNADSGHFMSIQGGVEEMKSGRVVAAPEVEPMSDIWFYQDGFIKNKMSPTMSLQVMGTIEPGAKLVLWNETRQPAQTWVAQMRGLITSITFRGMVIDVKGGKSYDKDHVVIMPEGERQSQNWEIVLLK
ncbi:uncharacterized protein crybg2 [Dunckerocampus dactyliophorus]|uniref:uncharacterized protein crybg2 n=1 Tax=Dunckerocampus dactyliophorus TaxID=161453 RepID=UPI0024060158|nr:uncharacterized protein crybg2 [Dunckerocampus dactyliophorus]